jgi:hypothetical protein
MTKDYYIIIEHRNHLIIMSDTAVSLSNDTLCHDFRTHQSFEADIFMVGVGQKDLGDGRFAMYAANCDQSSGAAADTDIGANDFARWDVEKNTLGKYVSGDNDMNGDVNANDFILYDRNKNKLSSVERD